VFTDWKSDALGFAMLDCLIGMAMFSLLSCVLIKAIAVDLQIWKQNIDSYQVVLKKASTFMLLDAWFDELKAPCSSLQDGASKLSIRINAPQHFNYFTDTQASSDILSFRCCETKTPPTKLFIGKYQGKSHWVNGLYSQSVEAPKKLLVGGVSSIHGLYCLKKNINQWKRKILGKDNIKETYLNSEGGRFNEEDERRVDNSQECDGILLGIQFENGSEWRQVLIP